MLQIIIPVYNDEDNLRQALDSLIKQDKHNFITAVVDDCSTDDIEAVVNSYRNKLPISYMKTPHNGGPGVARQYALDNMDEKIEYVMFLDSDDTLLPNATRALCKEMGITNADVLVSDFLVKGKSDEEDTVFAIDRNKTWMHGKIYRTSFLRQYGIRFPPVRVDEDVGFNIQVYALARKKAYLNEVTYCYNYNEKSITHSVIRPFILEYNKEFLVSVIYGLMHACLYLEDDAHFDQLVALCMRQFHILYEMAMYYKHNEESIRIQLDWFFNSPVISSKIQEREFFLYLAHYSTAYVGTPDVIVFPKYSFQQFITQFIPLPNYTIQLKTDIREIAPDEFNARVNK